MVCVGNLMRSDVGCALKILLVPGNKSKPEKGKRPGTVCERTNDMVTIVTKSKQVLSYHLSDFS